MFNILNELGIVLSIEIILVYKIGNVLVYYIFMGLVFECGY